MSRLALSVTGCGLRALRGVFWPRRSFPIGDDANDEVPIFPGVRLVSSFSKQPMLSNESLPTDLVLGL